ncbi:hypothetical protein DFA_05747 [Cavenderia fasciculata]|uniref:Uncharacterized protein n=1 Tax=Cavenderia fasciculata TaxID=261658 RepID=F4PMG6_CACFS|nr:uncharacterized protein DFA_05747 [Cavenderia fasciculata]EGG23613.1 hypothetical protein DFA_05747 [Cavenderia fasciculata]|eukprot:XP_004361464.1 hypothetical protein DFA_05747 [Cavenderia fasciculata]
MAAGISIVVILLMLVDLIFQSFGHIMYRPTFLFKSHSSISSFLKSITHGVFIKLDVPDICYYGTSMFQYNSQFFAGLNSDQAPCGGYIFHVDPVKNTSTMLATVSFDSENINYFTSFVFDNINGYLALISTNVTNYNNLEICMVNLNTYEVNQYAIPNKVESIITLLTIGGYYYYLKLMGRKD